ncbi:MAG: hypothetical protein KGQ49_05960 [Verrucomicrobia bacterium]|nr:hypothetical protein [Verrucomicrobiota bacterium]MBU6446924.1 hypothetical protein [Verrucomicrobiota bacterium]
MGHLARHVLATKKRGAILLEVLISLSLTAILLTFLFSFFVQSARIEKKWDDMRMCIANRSHLQVRLQTLFTSMDTATFYTKTFEKEASPSLIFSFDQGIDPDPAFSGLVLGRIYLDSKYNLCLATWPASEETTGPWRNEVLQKGVKSFEFEFLGMIGPSEQGVKEKITPLTPQLAWRSHWPKSTHHLPTLIRLRLQQEGFKDPIQYAFILPISECITYREGLG